MPRSDAQAHAVTIPFPERDLSVPARPPEPAEREPAATPPAGDTTSPDSPIGDEAPPPDASSASEPGPEPPAREPVATLPTAVPDKATVAVKTKELKQEFKAEYATRDSAARATFAKRLARKALATVDDPVGAWVLATEARDQSIQAGDYETFVALGRFLGERYGVDTHDDDAMAFVKLPVHPSVSPAWYSGLLAEITSRVDAMCDRDDFERATKYANAAKVLATRASDPSTSQAWVARIKELGTLKVQFTGHKAAKETLESTPNDRPANTKWGTYLCLLKGDFDAGLPHLAMGDDTTLSALAKRDMNPDRNATETAAIADAWWTIGERSKAFRHHAWRHSGELYQAAAPKLSGQAAKHAEQRLEELAAASAPRKPAATSLDQVLVAQPWNVHWNEPVRHHGRQTPDGQNEWSRDEVITFYEDGRVDSRYFHRFEIHNGIVELHVPDGADRPPNAGGPPGRFRRRHGRAMLIGDELRLIYGIMDRMDDPRNRGVGTRHHVE